VRLAALDLREISGVDLNPCFHLNSHVSHFLPNVIFSCKLRRIHVLACASEFMRVGTPI